MGSIYIQKKKRKGGASEIKVNKNSRFMGKEAIAKELETQRVATFSNGNQQRKMLIADRNEWQHNFEMYLKPWVQDQ